jgi:AMIN domain
MAIICLLGLSTGWAAMAAPPQAAPHPPVTTIRQVRILGSGNNVEIEILASQRVVPQTQVVAGPDRLVVDFRDALPSPQLRPVAVNRGEVKGVRVGLFESNPPTTRVVLDLNSPQPYQIFPSGNTVIVKVGAGSQANAPAQAVQGGAMVTIERSPIPPAAQPPRRTLEVSFQGGLLSVRAQKATLAQVLYEVHRQTGADIAVPAGAEQEQVVTDLGPGPAKEVLAALLNGTHYNFIILGADGDSSSLQRVILTPQFGEGASPSMTPPPQENQPADPSEAAMPPGYSDPRVEAQAVKAPPQTVNPSPVRNAQQPPPSPPNRGSEPPSDPPD